MGNGCLERSWEAPAHGGQAFLMSSLRVAASLSWIALVLVREFPRWPSVGRAGLGSGAGGCSVRGCPRGRFGVFWGGRRPRAPRNAGGCCVPQARAGRPCSSPSAPSPPRPAWPWTSAPASGTRPPPRTPPPRRRAGPSSPTSSPSAGKSHAFFRVCYSF